MESDGSYCEVIDQDYSYTDHPAYKALKGHSKLDNKAKRNLLSQFAERQKAESFPRSMIEDGSKAFNVLETLQQSGNTEKKRSKWNAAYMAVTILEMNHLLQQAKAAPIAAVGKPYRAPSFVNSFLRKVQPIIDEDSFVEGQHQIRQRQLNVAVRRPQHRAAVAKTKTIEPSLGFEAKKLDTLQ